MADASTPDQAVSQPGLHPPETIARLLDISSRQVFNLTKMGIFTRVRGKYELVPTVHAYIKFLRDRAGNSEKARTDFATERARLYKTRADIAQLEQARVNGNLIPREQVEEAWGHMVTNFRSRLLALPSKTAPKMVGLKSATAAQQILASEVSEALEELAATRIDYDTDDGPVGPSAGDQADPLDLEATAEDDGL